MKKLLVLSEDNTLIKSFIEYYNKSSFYYVEIYERNNININDYDGIIVDFFMKDIDWYNIIKQARDSYIFIVIPNLSINLKPILKHITINYIFYKPLCMEYFDEIMNYYYYDGIKTYLSYRREIYIIFKELGLPLKLLGTKYLFFMLSLVLTEKVKINMNLYYLTSKHYNVPVENVIKDISYAIESSFNKGGNKEFKERIFGYSSSKKNGSMSNLNFVYSLYVYIMYCVPEEELVGTKKA